MTARDVAAELASLCRKRVLVLEGALGTLIQGYRLAAADFRGRRFEDHPRELAGNGDLLVLTRPDVIESIHAEYLAAGADIIETNTFNAQAISQADYGLESLVYELNLAGARLSRRLADRFSEKTPDRPRFVAGNLGPTSATLSLAPRAREPARAVTFGRMRDAYAEQIRALIEGGVDLLLLETVFDTLNAKACLVAVRQVFEELGRELPVMISVTLGRSGRTPSGQTLGAFWTAIEHARPLAVGINCSHGASTLRPFVEELSRTAPVLVSVSPNAGLPNATGGYDETPELMGRLVGGFARDGLANFVGGCCGTTPSHIRAIAERIRDVEPRKPPPASTRSRFAGLEVLALRPDSNCIVAGERTDATRNAAFANLVEAGDYGRALEVAADQVRGGAGILEVNLDATRAPAHAMETFVKLVAGEPESARVPLLLDSSEWPVLEAGLRYAQGKCIVKSLGLEAGEVAFLEQARRVHAYGAAVLVVAVDERGRAETAAPKFASCRRAYELLTREVGFEPRDILFEPGLAVVAGSGHRRPALEFVEVTRRIKRELPGALVSGSVSDLSLAFRDESVRAALHSAFLRMAGAAGMDIGIVDPREVADYDHIPRELLALVEDVLLDRRPDALDRMVAYAERARG